MATSSKNIKTLVLASASPRRKELLEKAGYNLTSSYLKKNRNLPIYL